MTFVRNLWYVASRSKDLARVPLARTICGEPVALYRREDGAAVALEDACPHRLLPLSMAEPARTSSAAAQGRTGS